MDYARAVKVLQALHELGVDLAPTVASQPPPWCPQQPTGKQRDFLAVPAREALYGGAAGGGKSSCLLMAALQHVDCPGYSALLMRRTYRDLALPGALMDRAAQWLRPTAARWREVDKQWVFPSGATLTFGYMESENDKYRYQGAEFQFCVARTTPVLMADGRWRRIDTLRPGDNVATLMGPQPITRVHDVGQKTAVRAVTAYGSTIMSTSHRVLVDGMVWQPPTQYHDAGKGGARSPPSSRWPWWRAALTWWDRTLGRARARLWPLANRNPGNAVASKDERNTCAGSCDERPGLWPPRPSSGLAMLALPCPRCNALAARLLDCAGPGGRRDSSHAGWTSDCPACRDLRDEPPRPQSASAPNSIPRQDDVAEPCRPALAGDWEKSLERSHAPHDLLIHPHTRRVCGQVVGLRASSYSTEPVGEVECWDLTVASAAHYITPGGWVNSNCGVDELTQWSEAQYTYLLSRLRRLADVDIPLRARAASNPGGVGHNWVKARFVEGDGAKRAFIPARLEDNPHLDQGAYRESLDQLDDLTRRQLLLGEWVTDAGGLIYVVTADNLVPALPNDHWEYVLAVDLGASMTRPTTAFQVVAFNEGHPFTYLVESSQHAMGSPGAVAEEVRRYMSRYDFMTIAVDQGGLGRGYIEEFTSRYRIPAEEGQNRNKLGYRRLMRGDLERGLIKIVEPANQGLLREMAALRWNETETDCDKHAADHATDAALYAYVKSYAWLAENRGKPKLVGPMAPYQAEMDEMELEEERRLSLG